MLVVAASAGEQSNDLRAITAQHEHQGAGLEADFGVGLEFVERGDDFRDVPGALVFFVIRKKAGGAIAEVGDFVVDRLRAFDDAGGAEGGGSFFASGKKSGGARGGSDDGNFVRGTNDLDRQGTLLVLRGIAGPLRSGRYG